MTTEKVLAKPNISSKKPQKSPKVVVFFFLTIFLLGFSALIYFQIEKANEAEKLRFQILLNKCLRGESLSTDEAEEFCKLSNKQTDVAHKLDCNALPDYFYKQHLSDFMRESANCAENLKSKIENEGFTVLREKSENEKGWLISVLLKEKLLLHLRIMHRSSGASKFRKNNDYFRINIIQQSSFFVDQDGKPSQDKEDTHIEMNNCADLEKIFIKILQKYYPKKR
jgi:hypothetical protein